VLPGKAIANVEVKICDFFEKSQISALSKAMLGFTLLHSILNLMAQPEIEVGATVVTNVAVRRALLDLDTVLHRLGE
jgi:hypothetical protein